MNFHTCPTFTYVATGRFGFQMGSSLVPYITSVLWSSIGKEALWMILFVGALIPLILFEVFGYLTHVLVNSSTINSSI